MTKRTTKKKNVSVYEKRISVVCSAIFVTLFAPSEGQEKATLDYDGDIKITPFNMKEELEEDGYIDAQGTFIFNKNVSLLSLSTVTEFFVNRTRRGIIGWMISTGWR